jgi:hypothetical protein
MTIVGKTHAKWYAAPPPLFCAPSKNTGHWNKDANQWCDPKVTRTPFNDQEYVSSMLNGTTENCRFYAGQQGGNVDLAPSYNNSENPRNDVTGCCWWGRGVIQLTGRCNIGKLNKILKETHFLKDGDDLCKNPELICDSKYPTLKWISGLVYWCENVQDYKDEYFNYKVWLEELSAEFQENDKQKVLDGMRWDKTQFIYCVSGIVNRGCAVPGEKCEAFKDQTEERRLCFFQNILATIYDLKTPKELNDCPRGY